ncbi:NAD(P)-dependent oxidoreductase [Gordonia sp. CPCC 206044]|uniref:NAD-dependent epimerase/dehydratase family protein n=1 Tax=Gordonia sp. CPCC 206044 TaxID=3140793 RepID=UPI003AF39A9E
MFTFLREVVAMKVLLAGSTGAIGRPLTRALRAAGHEVVGLTRERERARTLVAAGVEPLVADALDRDALLGAAADCGLRIDAVIHQMTALSKPPARHSGMSRTNELRITGTRNLVDLATRSGARRFVTQSIVFGYGYRDHGTDLLTEDAPFGRPAGDRTDPHIEAMGVNEQLVIGNDDLDGVSLRYGLFYRPDDAAMRDMLRARKIPVPPGGGGELAWVHLDDAAEAAVAAVERGRPGAYNIVDDSPATWGEVTTAMAAAYGAPTPRVLPGWLIRMAAPYVGAMVLDTSMRVSAAKAREELGWRPMYPTVRQGVRASAG